MKIVTWNVNGIRAILGKGFSKYLSECDADMICIQESKCPPGLITLEGYGYYQYWNFADKPGYSGTILLTKKKPKEAYLGMFSDKFNHEGRIIMGHYEDFYLVNAYVPNSQKYLARLDFRREFNEEFTRYIGALQAWKPVIVCGDLNVAHKPIDLARPDDNWNSPGFSYYEREDFDKLLDVGLIDTFRYLYPDIDGAYSYWSYMRNARDKNIGWRLDYILVSECLKDRIEDVKIRSDIYGSDHCPVELYLS